MKEGLGLAESVWIPKEKDSGDITPLCNMFLLSVEGQVFFKILANHLTEYLLRNSYIDIAVQKGGVPGISGCLKHTGVITQLILEAKENSGDLLVIWLDLTNAYGPILHKLVAKALTTYHVQVSKTSFWTTTTVSV